MCLEVFPVLGQMLDIFRSNRASDDQPAGAEVAFVSDDVQASYDKALKAGAVSYDEPRQKPWGQTVAYVRDINGFLVEICSPMST